MNLITGSCLPCQHTIGCTPVVLSHIVKIVSADGDGALHLHLLHYTSQDTATDGHITSEGTLLVNVGSLNGLQIEENQLLHCTKN